MKSLVRTLISSGPAPSIEPSFEHALTRARRRAHDAVRLVASHGSEPALLGARSRSGDHLRLEAPPAVGPTELQGALDRLIQRTEADPRREVQALFRLLVGYRAAFLHILRQTDVK